MKNIIENYIKDLQKKNLSKNTLEAYKEMWRSLASL